MSKAEKKHAQTLLFDDFPSISKESWKKEVEKKISCFFFGVEGFNRYTVFSGPYKIFVGPRLCDLFFNFFFPAFLRYAWKIIEKKSLYVFFSVLLIKSAFFLSSLLGE